MEREREGGRERKREGERDGCLPFLRGVHAHIDRLAKQFVLPNLTMIYHFHNFGRNP